MAYVWVAIGSALGGMARHGVGAWSITLMGGSFPWGTLIVNIVGSFIIGAFAGVSAVVGPPVFNEDIRLFVAVGLCGGFTTFSAFSLQTLNLIQAGDWSGVSFNVAGSVVFCILAVWLGATAGASFAR